jgi:hypothetical protein
VFLKRRLGMLNQKINIAFINPPHADWCLANNAAYLMFQSHYKRYGKFNDQVNWIPAPYKFNAYESIEDIHEEVKDADIFLFSSYIWNYDICDSLCSLVKQINPNAICVLGGPQIGTNDPEFLNSRPAYDFILKPTKPGEEFVKDLIDSYFENNKQPRREDLSWELNSKKTCPQFMQDYSVYSEHFDYLKETRTYAQSNYLEPFCILETTRGCPYSCSFCEWGGGIGSKVYKKPTDIVKQDILALRDAGFRDMYLTDANFGAFVERDMEIFKFAYDNKANLTDISTMKSKDLARRISLVDACFNVVGTGPEIHSSAITKKEVGFILAHGDGEYLAKTNEGTSYISVVPTVSLQSVSEEAMKVAARVDLKLEDKLKLSEHINKKCHEQGYPVPALELILGMPGSTKDDFYREFDILWNFKSWSSFRHDYMFLPDSDLTKPDYIKKYNIQLVEVYTDLIDEEGVDNQLSFYKSKRNRFKTISSCYSYSYADMCEMWFMNIAGNTLLKEIYHLFENDTTPSNFGKMCYGIISSLNDFQPIHNEIADILNPNTPSKNIKRLDGVLRNQTINNLLSKYKPIIISELFKQLYVESAA